MTDEEKLMRLLDGSFVNRLNVCMALLQTQYVYLEKLPNGAFTDSFFADTLKISSKIDLLVRRVGRKAQDTASIKEQILNSDDIELHSQLFIELIKDSDRLDTMICKLEKLLESFITKNNDIN